MISLSNDGYTVLTMCIFGCGSWLYAYNCNEEGQKMRRYIAFGITLVCITVGVPMVLRLIGITQ